jgi:spore coat protein U-like protein
VFDATAPNNPIACGTANSYLGSSPVFEVSVNYLGSCQIAAGALNFGSTPGLLTALNASSNLSVICTSGDPYTIAMGPGQAPGATTSTRQMLGPGGLISYSLFRDSARSLNWGNNSGVDTYSGTGTGAAQSIPVYGQVPPQTVPSPGTYQDTVIVTLTF